MQHSSTATITLASCLGLILVTGCSGGSQLAPVPLGANPQTQKHSAHPSRVIVDQVPCNSGGAPAKVYVTESASNDVQVFDQNTLNPVNPGSFTGLSRPLGIDVSGSKVYVANSGAQNIMVFNKCGGTPQTLLDPPGPPYDVALDPAGNLYVSNFYNNTGYGEVRYYANASGTGVTIGDPLMQGVMFVTVDPQGDVFVAGVTVSTMHVDWCHNTRRNRCKAAGAIWQNTGIPLNNWPAGIRIDASGNLVVATQSGDFTTYGVPNFNQISTKPCPAVVNNFVNCMDFGFNSSGNRLFVAGYNGNNAWRVNYPSFTAPMLFGPGLNPTGQQFSAAAWPAPAQGG